MFESKIVAVETPHEPILLDRGGRSSRYALDVREQEADGSEGPAHTLHGYWRLDEEDVTDELAAATVAVQPTIGDAVVTYSGATSAAGGGAIGREMGAIEGPHLLGGDYHRHAYLRGNTPAYIALDGATKNGTELVAVGNCALGVWVKPDHLGTGGRQKVLHASGTDGDGTAGPKGGWWVEIDATDHWKMFYSRLGVGDMSPYNWSTFTGPVATGEWQLIVVRWNAPDVSVEFEVDGSIVGQLLAVNGDVNPCTDHDAFLMGVGGASNEITTHPLANAFHGSFAELEIHTSAWTAPATYAIANVPDSSARLARSQGTADDAARPYSLRASDDLPMRRIVDAQPAADGARVGDGYSDPRIVTHTGALDADTWAAKNIERVRILGAANALMRNDGRMRWRPEGFDTVQMTVRRHEQARIAAEATANGLVLSLVAGDPVVYSAAQHVSSVQGATGFDDVQEIENAGNWETRPRFVIYGPLADVVIENLTTGELLDLTANGGLSIASGHYLDVDTALDALTVLYDGDPTDSRYTNVDTAVSEFFTLEQGTNEIQVTGTGANAATRVFVVWRDAWMP